MSNPNNPNPNISYQGTNSQGNRYTNYNNGAYRYSNTDAAGKPESHYFDTGKGHGFYSKNNTPEAPGYSFHENKNQGYRVYSEKGNSNNAKK